MAAMFQKVKYKLIAWTLKGAIEHGGIRRKIVLRELQKFMEEKKMMEKITEFWTKLQGLKTHLVGASMSLTALIAFIDEGSKLLADGFQYSDVVAVSHSPQLYAFFAGLAMMTGRSAITKLADKFKQIEP